MSNSETFKAVNPATDEILDGDFNISSKEQIDVAVSAAVKAFDIYRKKDKDSIADFLDRAADEILNLGDALLERCHQETALPMGRLTGERGRTMNQLKLFASVVRDGTWIDARIDTAVPDREPIPKSDIRHMLIPLGPVAVFGASNFPLAFSVAGGDTASALAAGCPVVVKGHPAHPGTSEMVAGAIIAAAAATGMPEGTFAIVQGNTNAVGEALVKHPEIKAVGFTGSFGGGKALFDLANARPEPIPVFAEMGSTNPVFILPDILEQKAEELAAGMAGSITMGVGQFCTNPGLAFIQKSDAASAFSKELTSKINEAPAASMLTAGIKAAYENGVKETLSSGDVEAMATGPSGSTANSAEARVFKTSIENFNQNSTLAEETFGPSNVLVEAQTKDQLLEAARNLEGHLTATVHGTMKDFEAYTELFDILEKKVGRVVVNGYPTGVEVCHSMVHGGPYPSTTASQSTSVGTNAINRFARPVCYQDYPQTLLPAALKDGNPLGIWRLVNGQLSISGV
ncbi:MAG: alpha-ketoglutaric semialdehyde dehydrogenase [Cyclobacteriaceae bacterium]|jgi:NADP-dependent aldehyde dehydrogenase